VVSVKAHNAVWAGLSTGHFFLSHCSLWLPIHVVFPRNG